MLVGTGEAHSQITRGNYQSLRAKAEFKKDHAEDVLRFFSNHPKPAHSNIGKRVIRTEKKAYKFYERQLTKIREFVYSGKFLPYVWYRIGSCETGYGGTPNWRHNSGTYQGAFGFAVSSWDSFNTFGYPSEAYEATPEQQYRVALAIYHRYGFSGWGCA